MTIAEDATVLEAARRGDRRAREQLVAGHLRVVRSVASQYRNFGLPFDDLVQEGSLGLLELLSLIPNHPGNLAERGAGRVEIALLVLFPYLLFRFTGTFRRPGRRLIRR